MKKSGLADSPFFSMPAQEEASTPHLDKPKAKVKIGKTKNKAIEDKNQSNREPMTPRYRDTMVSRYHETVIGIVRKAVKELGKEAATHRFTMDEKRAIADLIYTYKNQGIRTSENEITRIAVNFIVQDYKENGENSILEKALKALNE